jgi:glycosyltransferase involved in cell wall biosynthesis
MSPTETFGLNFGVNESTQMAAKDIDISIVIPVYNEEESVEELVSKLVEMTRKLRYSCEIILVDDGSRDRTWDLIEKLKKSNDNLRGIKFRRNYGQTNAMVAGFEYSRGRFIVTIDGDLQNDPADIPMLIEKIEEGYDIVSGWRKERKDHFTRVFPSIIANRLISWSTGVRLHDYGCSLKAYRANSIKSLKAYGEMHRFFPALARLTGATVTEVPVKHHPRRFGVSKYGFDRVLKVMSDIFAINLIIRFSSNPLKGFVWSAVPSVIMTGVFGLLGILALVLEWTSGKALFFVMLSGLSAVSAINLVMLGVLGELVIGTSDLTHSRLPEVGVRRIIIRREKHIEPGDERH